MWAVKGHPRSVVPRSEICCVPPSNSVLARPTLGATYNRLPPTPRSANLLWSVVGGPAGLAAPACTGRRTVSECHQPWMPMAVGGQAQFYDLPDRELLSVFVPPGIPEQSAPHCGPCRRARFGAPVIVPAAGTGLTSAGITFRTEPSKRSTTRGACPARPLNRGRREAPLPASLDVPGIGPFSKPANVYYRKSHRFNERHPCGVEPVAVIWAEANSAGRQPGISRRYRTRRIPAVRDPNLAPESRYLADQLVSDRTAIKVMTHNAKIAENYTRRVT